jgi:predicted SPOUT superfamily RNA methylase MTH1
MSSLSVTPTGSHPVSIAIPASFIDVHRNLAQQTIQIGYIARAAAIFRVDEILIYPDQSSRAQTSQRRLITRVLEYMETPQYLRKYLFAKQPELRYVGLLPPLRTPHHPVEKQARTLRTGDVREGYAFRHKGRAVVDVGMEYPLVLGSPLPPNAPCRVTVRVERTAKDSLEASLVPSATRSDYWGYRVTDAQRPLGEFLPRTSAYSLIVATSRRGTPIRDSWATLQIRWRDARRILILFGSHAEGLTEIMHRQGHELTSLAHFVINTIPGQGVATVRTEEAVMLSLAVFRALEAVQNSVNPRPS